MPAMRRLGRRIPLDRGSLAPLVVRPSDRAAGRRAPGAARALRRAGGASGRGRRRARGHARAYRAGRPLGRRDRPRSCVPLGRRRRASALGVHGPPGPDSAAGRQFRGDLGRDPPAAARGGLAREPRRGRGGPRLNGHTPVRRRHPRRRHRRLRAGRAPEREPRSQRLSRRSRARLRPVRGRTLARGHSRRPAARLLAFLGDRPRGPLAAAGEDPRRLLSAQRLRRIRGRSGGLRRVGPRLELRRARALPATCRRGAPDAPSRGGRDLTLASSVSRSRRRQWFRQSAERRWSGALERGLAKGVTTSAGELQAGQVVLAASAYGSPAILLRSGIGPESGLPVGEGLMDHVGVGAGWEPTDLLQAETTRFEAAHPLFMGQITVALRSSSCPDHLCDLFLFPAIELGETGYEISGAAFAMKPRSRGRVGLNGSDSRTPLAIEHGFLTDPHDATMVEEGFQALRDLVASEPVRRYAARELRPGPKVSAREHVLAEARGFFHPVGTCALGSVVDPTGRVFGFENLVVADASIIPSIPSSNTNLTTAAVAERIAELL